MRHDWVCTGGVSVHWGVSVRQDGVCTGGVSVHLGVSVHHVQEVRWQQKRACTGGETAAGARVGMHRALVSR